MFFGLDFSHFSLSLTLPSGREYIPGVVKRGDSSAGAGTRGVSGKANSYPFSISDVKQAWERKIDPIKSIIAIGVPAYLLYALLKGASALPGIGNFNLGFPAKTIR